jgi:hypothetical protein
VLKESFKKPKHYLNLSGQFSKQGRTSCISNFRWKLVRLKLICGTYNLHHAGAFEPLLNYTGCYSNTETSWRSSISEGKSCTRSSKFCYHLYMFIFHLSNLDLCHPLSLRTGNKNKKIERRRHSAKCNLWPVGWSCLGWKIPYFVCPATVQLLFNYMGNNPRPITLYILHDLKPQVNSIAGNPSQDCMQCSVKKSWIKLTKLDSLTKNRLEYLHSSCLLTPHSQHRKQQTKALHRNHG